MTTSGSTSYNPELYTILKGALRLVKAYPAHDEPRPEDVESALEALNLLLKSWQAEGFLWLKQWATLFLEKDQIKYALPGAKCAATYAETTLSSDEETGQTVLSVTSSAGMTAADVVGIALDAGTWHWTTIVSVDTTTQITVTAGLPSAAASGRPVVAYTTAIKRPTRIDFPFARIYQGSDIPLVDEKPISRKEYAALPSKDSSGTPIKIYYDPQISTGYLYVWPAASDCRDQLIFTCDRPIEDMLNDVDNFDVPQEQLIRVKYALALELATEFSLPQQDFAMLSARYADLDRRLSAFDTEQADTYFEVER
jgi:hypothetical protein